MHKVILTQLTDEIHIEQHLYESGDMFSIIWAPPVDSAVKPQAISFYRHEAQAIARHLNSIVGSE